MFRLGVLTRRLLAVGAIASALGFAACVAWAALRSPGGATGPVHVVFRYDDYSQRSQESVNEAVLDAFRRHGLPVTVAVIPCPGDVFAPAGDAPCAEPLDASRVATLVAAHAGGVAEIALHGYSHTNAGNAAFLSEFYGVAPAEQRHRLERGLDEVEHRTGVRPSTFVPPFDAYDAATLEAIEALGMTAISGGLGASNGATLSFVPNTVYIKKVREAIVALRRSPDPGTVLVSIFHPWDLEEADEMVPLTGSYERPVNREQLDSLLAWLAEQPDVEVTTVGALAASGADLGAARFAMGRAYAQSALWSLLPPPLEGPPRYYLHTVDRYRHLAAEGWLRVASYSAAVVVLAAGIVAAVLAVLRQRVRLLAIPAGAVLLGAAVLAVGPRFMGALGWKDFAVLLVAAGTCLGGVLALLEMRNSEPQPRA